MEFACSRIGWAVPSSFVFLGALIIVFGSSVLISAEKTTIYPAPIIYATQGSTVTIWCSFKRGLGSYRLSVNGDRTQNLVNLARTNISRPLSVLNGSYIVRNVSLDVRVEFRFITSIASDGDTLQCFFIPFNQPEQGSEVTTINIYCKNTIQISPVCVCIVSR